MVNVNAENRVAIVTGASGGLGRDIALTLNRAGWSVVIHGRNIKRLEQVMDDMDSRDKVAMVAGHINERNQHQQLVQTAKSRFGRIDALVNNAGIFSPKPFLDVTEEDLDGYLSTNLKGTYFLTQAVLPTMLSQSGGSVLNVGTVLVDHALGGVPASAPVSSKGAIHALTRQLAAEFGKNNIRVNTLAPGIIRSPMHAANGFEDDSLAGLHLLERIGESQEIADMARQILDNKFVSGAIVNLDGGHVAGHHLS